MELRRKDLERMIKEKRSFVLYIFTPLCSGCALANRLINIAQKTPTLAERPLYKANINHMPERAKDWQIAAVPALVVFQEGAHTSINYNFTDLQAIYRFLKGN